MDTWITQIVIESQSRSRARPSTRMFYGASTNQRATMIMPGAQDKSKSYDDCVESIAMSYKPPVISTSDRTKPSYRNMSVTATYQPPRILGRRWQWLDWQALLRAHFMSFIIDDWYMVGMWLHTWLQYIHGCSTRWHHDWHVAVHDDIMIDIHMNMHGHTDANLRVWAWAACVVISRERIHLMRIVLSWAKTCWLGAASRS